MPDITKHVEAMRVIGNVIEFSEPIYGCNSDIKEYVMPAENYEALVELFASLQAKRGS